MSDPTLHNALYAAGWKAAANSKPRNAIQDRVVRRAVAHLRVGDQLRRDLMRVWLHGYDDRRAEGPAQLTRSCPTCMSPPGKHCRTSSGAVTYTPHAARR